MTDNQQLDVTCLNCGWQGARTKIMNRPCPRCGRATVVFGTKSEALAKVKAKLEQARAEAEAFVAETVVSAKPKAKSRKKKAKK